MTKSRLQALVTEYGSAALGTYFGIFFLVLGGFAAAFAFGFSGTSLAKGQETFAGLGVFGAAYVATKLTQPLRIVATIALTPIVARVILRRRAPESKAPEEPAS